MLSISEIKTKKEEYHMTNAQLASLSGVPLGTVQKVLGNTTRSPRLETVQALSAVFEDRKLHAKKYYLKPDDQLVQEASPAYKTAFSGKHEYPFTSLNTHSYDRQGTYTIDDYLALPEDQRVELIDGVIYDMAAPTFYHQVIGAEIFRLISNFIRERKGECISAVAPVDVQLDCDNRTMVQPDVMVLCHRERINFKRVFGAPDFVAEVLSPSTKGKDLLIKSHKYRDAGVQEYWLIDPMKNRVMVYDFRDPEDPQVEMYTFEDRIPVLIFDGELVIDMKEIMEYYSFVRET